MSFIPLFTVDPTEDLSNGIFKKFRNLYSKDIPLTLSASRFNVGKNNLLIWGVTWQIDSEGTNPAHLLINFENYGVKLTHVSFRGNQGSCFSNELYMYGINKDSSLLISKPTFESICGKSSRCNSNDANIFAVSNTNTIFTSLYFISYNSSCLPNHIAGSGFELFGSIFQIRTIVTCNIIFKTHMSLFFNFILFFK